MAWIDVVMIVFAGVMAIHMGLVDAILSAYNAEDKDIPIVTCPKCLSFHAVLWYLILTRHNVIHSVAASFLASYCAIWFDLFLGQLDMWYERFYRQISEGGDTQVHHESNR